LFGFRARVFVSCFTNASFDALNNMRTALSIRSASVSPGTGGAGCGFIWSDCTVFGGSPARKIPAAAVHL